MAKQNNKRDMAIADRESLGQKLRARAEKLRRNQPHLQAGILTDEKFSQQSQLIKQGFAGVMRTTLGNSFSQQGVLRDLTNDDLVEFDRKINALQGKYQGGIKPSFVINAALAIDRQRAGKEIPWAHPVSSRFFGKQAKDRSLVVSFVTAASGKHGETKHYVNVEFVQFEQITTHRLLSDELDARKKQAIADVKLLKDSLIKFDCDCGRHTYWYRYIASIGKFAYIGNNPLGREETGFPKIRNPQLKGIACKHVLRTMLTIQREKGFEQFMMKACLNRYKTLGQQKDIKTQTTKRDFEASIKRQNKARTDVLSEAEKRLAPKLLSRYRAALERGMLTRHIKDSRTTKQKLTELAKYHSVEAYLDLIK